MALGLCLRSVIILLALLHASTAAFNSSLGIEVAALGANFEEAETKLT